MRYYLHKWKESKVDVLSYVVLSFICPLEYLFLLNLKYF